MIYAYPTFHRGVEDAPAEPCMTHDHVIGEGDLLPDVALVGHEGAPFRFSDHRGRPLVLVLHRHLA